MAVTKIGMVRFRRCDARNTLAKGMGKEREWGGRGERESEREREREREREKSLRHRTQPILQRRT